MADNVDTQLFQNADRLKDLRIEHRDLDDVIDRLSGDPCVDQLELRRLKKRKLMLKVWWFHPGLLIFIRTLMPR